MPSRPRLLPAPRWARVALLLLLAFTLVRGGIWATTVPSFWAPDEDYHFLYVEYLSVEHSLPAPDKPLYPPEYGAMVPATHYYDYASSPRTVFEGDPHASVATMGRLPYSSRRADGFGRGVGIVHPPLYQLLGAAVNLSLGHASMLTRVAAVRWLSAAIGVLAVWFGWVLAAQVLAREGPRLLVALLVAVQPMINFLSGIVNHDIALIAAFTAVLAMLCFILRTPPRARQGAWLGGALVAALLVKASALVLVPLAALVYLTQALLWKEAWRDVARSVAVAAGLVALLALPWYVRSLLTVHSATGFTGDLVGSAPPVQHGLGAYLSQASLWTKLTYRSYWFHFLWPEIDRKSVAYYIPIVSGGVGVLGLVVLTVRKARRVLDREDPALRQVILLVLAALALWLPIMWIDVQRGVRGAGFSENGGRYLLPAYAGVATVFVAGLGQLARGRARSVLFAAVALAAVWVDWHTWTTTYVHRYFGYGSWSELFRRMSFDRPEFVTGTTWWVMSVLALLTLVGAGVVTLGSGPLGPRIERIYRPSARTRATATAR